MNKWMRRILYLTVALLIAAGIGLYVLYHLSSATPDWYQPRMLSEEQIREAGRLAVNKALTLREQASELHLAERRARLETEQAATRNTRNTTREAFGGTTRPAAPAALPIEVSFTSDELNALFHQWTKPQGRDQQIAQYIGDPQIILLDNELILAGKVKGIEKLDGRVVSVHFAPKLDAQGKLQMDLEGLRMGYLPVPDSAWEQKKSELVSLLQRNLPDLQQKAQIDDSGQANGATMGAIFSELLLNVLSGRPAEPVLFIPLDDGHGIPVKLRQVKIANKTLTLQAEPLNAAQRHAMMQTLKDKDSTEKASAQEP